MSALPKDNITVAQFLEWAEAQDQGRFELLRGRVVAMAPERVAHSRAKFAVTTALRHAIRNKGVNCEAIVDGPAVVVDERTSFLPDALVNCGERIAGDRLTAPNPVVVVEILSPTTKHIDKAWKLFNYFLVPGLEHYVIVDLDNRAVIHHRRTGENLVQTALLRTGMLHLDPPGIEVAVSELFGDA